MTLTVLINPDINLNTIRMTSRLPRVKIWNVVGVDDSLCFLFSLRWPFLAGNDLSSLRSPLLAGLTEGGGAAKRP